MYYEGTASKAIREDLQASWRMGWRDFLDVKRGKRCTWTFPYKDNQRDNGKLGTATAGVAAMCLMLVAWLQHHWRETIQLSR
jgi:hypothetical protein